MEWKRSDQVGTTMSRPFWEDAHGTDWRILKTVAPASDGNIPRNVW